MGSIPPGQGDVVVIGRAWWPDGIRSGIERVLAEGSYRAAAGLVADELRRYPAVDDYVTRTTEPP